MGTVPIGCTMQFADALRGWCWTGAGAAGSRPSASTARRTAARSGDWFLRPPATAPKKRLTTCRLAATNSSRSHHRPSGGRPVSALAAALFRQQHGRRGALACSFTGALSRPRRRPRARPQRACSGWKDVAIVHLGGGPGGGSIDHELGQRPLVAYPSAASGAYARLWNVDLIDPTHWRATDGDVIVSTDDAGARWNRWTPS